MHRSRPILHKNIFRQEMLSQQFGDILTFPGSTRLGNSRYFVHRQRIRFQHQNCQRTQSMLSQRFQDRLVLGTLDISFTGNASDFSIKTANERKVQNVAAGLSIHILQTEGVISGLHFINAKHGAPSCQWCSRRIKCKAKNLKSVKDIPPPRKPELNYTL